MYVMGPTHSLGAADPLAVPETATNINSAEIFHTIIAANESSIEKRLAVPAETEGDPGERQSQKLH